MSTTQQFFASGAGNGFPFCFNHQYTKAELESDEGVELFSISLNFAKFTIKEAFNLFWNLKTQPEKAVVKFSFADGSTSTRDQSGRIRLTEPFERVCISNPFGLSNILGGGSIRVYLYPFVAKDSSAEGEIYLPYEVRPIINISISTDNTETNEANFYAGIYRLLHPAEALNFDEIMRINFIVFENLEIPLVLTGTGTSSKPFDPSATVLIEDWGLEEFEFWEFE
jgi:hypothetical protein